MAAMTFVEFCSTHIYQPLRLPLRLPRRQTRWRTLPRAAILGIPILTVLVACSGDDNNLPATIEFGDVVIETDPLRLTMPSPYGSTDGTADGTFVMDHFIEVGTVGAVDDNRYYDPRFQEEAIWHVATAVTAYDGQTLTLDNGVRLTVAEGPIDGSTTLTLDASDVDNAVLLRLVTPRDPNEPIYGFGENFASAEAGGSVREMQFRVDFESESSLNESHVPVPLSLWPARGVGLFVEDPRPGAFDIGAAVADRIIATFTLASPGPLSAHLYTADEPLGLVRGYIAMTAPPAVPPMWAFAPQQWRNAHNSSQEVRDDAAAMRAEGIPGSVMWIDNPWQTAYNDFIFDENRFSEPETLIADLTALGYRVVVWSTPYVNRKGLTSGDFVEASELGYLVTGQQGTPIVFPWQDGPGALVDFTSPGATEWWRERIARVVDLGISGFKLDFGEDIVPELVGRLTPMQLAAGDAQTMHGAYAYYYHEAYLGALPPGDGFLITRAGAYGDQAVNTTIWPGDLDSDFSRFGTDDDMDGEYNVGGLPAAISAGLSLSVSGYPFFGSDIGGFREGLPTTETLIRWAQYAALGTIMQLGGGGRSHNPWDTELFDPPALDVYREYSRLHMDLIPYLYTLARIAGSDGTPVTRPTRFMYPDASSDDATFLVGEALFVAPVIEEGATIRTVILPPGTWVHWHSGESLDGDGATEVTIPAPLEQLPLWRKADHFVPMFALPADTLEPATDPSVTSYAEADIGRELRLLISPYAGVGQISLYDQFTADVATDGADYLFTATAGTQFDIVTFDVDTGLIPASALNDPGSVQADSVELPQAADEVELRSCPAPGCYLAEPGASRLRVRAYLPDGDAHEIQISG